jgi:two-component system cell cycle sensor histidine kinase/response regulator CckA
MKDEDKSKDQLIDELSEVRRRIALLEASERKLKQAEEALRESARRLELAYAQSIIYAEQLNQEITEHKKAEEALQKARDGLEERVEERTVELSRANLMLKREIAERRQAEEKRKQLEAQIRQAHKMESMGLLAGGIAHEFNNIIGIIIGNTEIALYDIMQGYSPQPKLEEVLKACLRAEDVVKQILAFSRQGEQEKKPLQVSLVVKEALQLLQATLPATIDISKNIESRSGAVMADPTQIHQVLMNLCTNAAHTMREDRGVLGVSLVDVNIDADLAAQYPDFHPGPYVRLTVSDTGHGIKPELLERIFDPYFTTKRPDEGSGMGLAVVHGIVKSHGGMITVESKVGEGTTFHIFFPRVEREVTFKTEPLEHFLMGNERVLFVDDEQAMVDMGKQMLEALGYKVAAKTSGTEALEVFRAHPDKFDLVITDQTMPNVTGEMLAQELMRIRPDIPIILCTGYSEVITEEKAKAMGIREFVMKPIVTRNIAETIRSVLDKKRT